MCHNGITAIIALSALLCLFLCPAEASGDDLEDVHSIYEPGLLEEVEKRERFARPDGLTQTGYKSDQYQLTTEKQSGRRAEMSTGRGSAGKRAYGPGNEYGGSYGAHYLR